VFNNQTDGLLDQASQKGIKHLIGLAQNITVDDDYCYRAPKDNVDGVVAVRQSILHVFVQNTKKYILPNKWRLHAWEMS
jgi:hypothetical protein